MLVYIRANAFVVKAAAGGSEDTEKNGSTGLERKIKNKYLITEKCVPVSERARQQRRRVGGMERAGKVNEGMASRRCWNESRTGRMTMVATERV